MRSDAEGEDAWQLVFEGTHSVRTCGCASTLTRANCAQITNWRKGLELSTRGQFICASMWRHIWERVDEIGPRLVQVKWVKGHATVRHVDEGTIALWQSQAKELGDEQAWKGSALHPCVKKFEHNFPARTTFLGWLAKFSGTSPRLPEGQSMERRGAEGAEVTPCTSWEASGAHTRDAGLLLEDCDLEVVFVCPTASLRVVGMDPSIGAVNRPHEGLREVDAVHVVAFGHDSTASVRARCSATHRQLLEQRVDQENLTCVR